MTVRKVSYEEMRQRTSVEWGIQVVRTNGDVDFYILDAPYKFKLTDLFDARPIANITIA